jgi:4'-phosphopantetheinyl transferase
MPPGPASPDPGRTSLAGGTDARLPRLGTAFAGACDAHGIAPGATRPLALFFDLARWRPWLDEAWSLLDPAEQGRAVRKRRPDDRDDLVLAYALHRLSLARLLDRAPASVPLGRDARGRPFLQGDLVATSLSHAAGAVAVATADCGPVGIDLEPASRASAMPELAARVWHPAEAASAQLGGGDPGWALLQAWVCKEAVLKAAGIGLAREMCEFRAAPGQRVPLPREHGGAGPATVRVHALDVGHAWVAAAASADDAAPTVAWLQPLEADDAVRAPAQAAEADARLTR